MNIEDKGLGRIQFRDPKSHLFLMTASEEYVAQPTVKSKTWKIPRSIDQGETSSCTGHGSKHFLLAEPIRTKRGPSAMDIYRMAQLIDEWEGEEPTYYGSSVNAAMKVLHKLGHVSEYRWAYDVETAKNWILTVSPVVVGTTWYRDMFYPDPKTGLVTATGREAGGHCFLCYRYDDRTGLFWFLNSWGISWGLGGRFCMSGEDFSKLIEDNGEIATARESIAPKIVT